MRDQVLLLSLDIGGALFGLDVIPDIQCVDTMGNSNGILCQVTTP